MKFRFVGALASGIGLAVALTACSGTSSITPSSISSPVMGPQATVGTMTVSGSVKSLYASGHGFYIQVTKGCGAGGLLNIHTNSSTIFSGAKLAAGETATVVGTGSCTMSGVTATSVTISSAAPVAGKLPPEGVFNACEIDTALSTCEQEDQAMRQTGLTWEANFIGVLAAHKTGANSLQSWFQYDASIGMSQFLVIKEAINDPVNVLTGNILISRFTSSLAKDCGATNNEQIISCIVSVAKTVPNFNYMWDLYDEPGCPNQSLSYCPGTLAGGNYNNVHTLASYIHSIDPAHGISGVNFGDCCNGSSQAAIDQTLFSWLAASPSTGVGWDYYPIPQSRTGQPISNLGTDATAVAHYLQTSHPGMPMNVTLQAFSWYQEHGMGCTSITMCPFPTQAQMQSERDQVVYYAARAHQPISVVFWYYWPDITCLGATENYPGCNASANKAALKGAITAPFPATAPS